MAAIICLVYLTTSICIPSTGLLHYTNKQTNPFYSTLISLLVVSMNTTGCVVENMQHLKASRRWSAYRSSCTAGPELRCTCFSTACFETYAAYALLVGKELFRDGMVYVLLSSPWGHKLHTGTRKPNYVQSPSIHMLQ